MISWVTAFKDTALVKCVVTGQYRYAVASGSPTSHTRGTDVWTRRHRVTVLTRDHVAARANAL
jgi:hypothetical protein